MKAPDKIYLQGGVKAPLETWTYRECPAYKNIEYIRKDALLDYLQKELERLWELIPDASNETPSQMEMRYLGEYMATERLTDKIESL